MLKKLNKMKLTKLKIQMKNNKTKLIIMITIMKIVPLKMPKL